MKLKRFTPSDLVSISAWHVAHGLPPVPAEIVPKVGLVAPGVAALFIYQTDSSIALIEGLISNPAAPLRDRIEAIDQLMDACTELAFSMGFKQVIGFPKDNGTLKRAKRHSYEDLGPCRMILKRL